MTHAAPHEPDLPALHSALSELQRDAVIDLAAPTEELVQDSLPVRPTSRFSPRR